MKQLHYKSVLSWLLEDFQLTDKLEDYLTLYPKFKVELRTNNFLIEVASIQDKSIQLKAFKLKYIHESLLTSVRHFSTDFNFDDRKYFLRSIGCNV